MSHKVKLNDYERATEILQQVYTNPNSFDAFGFLLKLTKTHPNVLVEAYESHSTSLRFRVISYLKDSFKIRAIKIYRDETGVGLREAKEAVEKIAEEEGIQLFKGNYCGQEEI